MIRLAYTNLAKYHSPTDPNSVAKRWVESNIPTFLDKVRRERTTLEERWMRMWRIWNVELDSQSYMGRSRTYLAAGRNALETWVIGLHQGIFPMSEWFDVMAVHGVGQEGAARAWKALQRDFLSKRMRIKFHMPTFLRQFVTYGTAIAKHNWDEQYVKARLWEQYDPAAPPDEDFDLVREEPDQEREENSLSLNLINNTSIRLVDREVPVHIGPSFRVVDLFRFFVFPTTAVDLQSAIACFEDVEATIEDIERIAEIPMDYMHPELGNVFENTEELIRCGGKLNDEALEARQDRQRKWNDNARDPYEAYKDLAKGHVNLTELYYRGEIPGAKDPQTGEEYGEIDWLITVVNNNWCIRLHPNPYYTKKRPYQEARMFRVVDEYYGRGVTEAIASMQYMLNDINNLTLDNVVDALNPIILINEDLVSNMESLRLAPNAKWFVDPKGVQFVAPPNVAQIGQATIQLMQGFIQDGSMASFIMQGQAAPRGRGRAQNTAAGLNMLLQQNAGAFQMVLADLEEQLMVPILEWNYDLAQQFMTDKLALMTTGVAGLPLVEQNIGFEDIFGKYQYTWKGSQGVRETMTLTSQMQSFLQLAIQIRQADPTAQFQIKWPEVLKNFITKGMGLPNAESWIITPEDVPPIPPPLAVELCKSHREVEPSPADDHIASLEYFMAALQTDPVFAQDPIARALLEALMAKHANALQTMMMQAQQMAMQQPELGPGPGTPQPGGPPQAGPPAGPEMMADQARTMAGQGQLQPGGI